LLLLGVLVWLYSSCRELAGGDVGFIVLGGWSGVLIGFWVWVLEVNGFMV